MPPDALDADVRGRLERFIALLKAWQRTHNLVSDAALDDLWHRHVEDSLQLLDHVPPGIRTWVDLGSGGGFPGLVCAIAFKGEGPAVTLVESRAKKCAFLRHAARETATPVRVVADRIEAHARREPASANLVTARALAPLAGLFALGFPLLSDGGTMLLPKGEEAEREIAEAEAGWQFDLARHPSRTAPGAVILHVSNLRPKGA